MMERHIARYSGDHRTQYLLAQVLLYMSSWFGVKDAELWDFAPWFFDPKEVEEKREERDFIRQREERAKIMGNIGA